MLPHDRFTTAIDEAVAKVGSARDRLDIALVNEASSLLLAADLMEAARRERLHHAAVLAGDFTDGDDGRDDDRVLDEAIDRAKAISSSMLYLSHLLRSNDLATVGRTDSEVDFQGDSSFFSTHAMETAREAERSRLAREIHDGPAQVLANALFIVGIAEHTVKRDPAAVPAQLSTIRDLLRDGIAEIRRFMFELRPSLLDDQGLMPTLRYYAAEHGRVFGTQVSLTIDDQVPTLSGDQELCLFRIVQEALHNIQKHANVEHAEISLLRHDRWLELEVADGGRGFDPAQTSADRGSGVGLRGMRERAALIGAALSVESAVGGGTRIKLTIPLGDGAALDYDDLEHRGGAREPNSDPGGG